MQVAQGQPAASKVQKQGRSKQQGAKEPIELLDYSNEPYGSEVLIPTEINRSSIPGFDEEPTNNDQRYTLVPTTNN